eukprot:scaffold585624_cov59-Attheya_sp.AAC.1
MHPSQGNTASSKKLIHRREQALNAGVGAFHVIPIPLDDGFNAESQQHERRRRRQRRNTRPKDSAHFDDEEERNTVVPVERGRECGQLSTDRNRRGTGESEQGDLAVADAVHYNDEVIPYATEYDPDSKPPLFKNRRFRLYGFAVMFILFVIIVGIISIEVIQNRQTNKQISADASGSQTTFPTPGPTNAGREAEGILGELVKISSIEKLNDPNSAQFKAAQWIQFVDPQQLGVDADNLFQRYALVVMYFSLQENGSWVFCGADDSSHKDPNLCNGPLLVYVGDPQNPNDSKIYEEFEDEAKWLSAKSECFWFGLYCNKDMTVQMIEIVENNLVGTLPEELASLTFLEHFTIVRNGLHGTLPHWMFSYRQLIDFELHYNQFTGKIPDAIYEMESLERFNLAGNELTGTVSTQIGKLEKLTDLIIMDNMMSGTIPTEIGSLSNLVATYWGENNFDTTLPTEVGRLGTLQEFWMFNMGLKGTIPTEIGLMTDLQYVRVEGNLLEGSIPEEIFNARNMTHVDAENNNFDGTLSTSIGQMVNLQQLLIQYNYLTGTIPTQLGQLMKLREALMFSTISRDPCTLWIHHNDFSGEVPKEICDLKYYMSLGDNPLLDVTGQAMVLLLSDRHYGCFGVVDKIVSGRSSSWHKGRSVC